MSTPDEPNSSSNTACNKSNDDVFKTAGHQRKIIAQMYNEACGSLDNASTVYLLENKLKEYSATVVGNGTNIYDSRLKEVLARVNKPIIKSLGPSFTKKNLDVKVQSLLRPCEECENVSETEFTEFLKAFDTNSEDKNRKISKGLSAYTIKSHQIAEERCAEIAKENRREASKIPTNCFKTARDELYIQSLKKNTNMDVQNQKKKLGTRRNINSKFISPLLSNNGSNEDVKSEELPTEIDERLKNIEPKMVELIKSEIMDCGADIHWNDIAGLEFAKTAIQEAVVWPMLRPDIFTGLRRPPKGILLFGPPGTGKTLIGKCVASQSKSTFFSISASSLTSKWVGDGEKMVRALFSVARVYQPAVIFIDEIDSLLSQRSNTEHESSRRIKTEFLVQLDGATTDSNERILVIGATNRPQELDEAARRRFVKRLHIPLPEYNARLQLVEKLISSERHSLTSDQLNEIANLSDGYSGADIRNLCSEASLGPIRAIDMKLIEKIQATEVRGLLFEDFEKAFTRVRSSVSPTDLDQYIAWDKTYGSGSGF